MLETIGLRGVLSLWIFGRRVNLERVGEEIILYLVWDVT